MRRIFITLTISLGLVSNIGIPVARAQVTTGASTAYWKAILGPNCTLINPTPTSVVSNCSGSGRGQAIRPPGVNPTCATIENGVECIGSSSGSFLGSFYNSSSGNVTGGNGLYSGACLGNTAIASQSRQTAPPGDSIYSIPG